MRWHPFRRNKSALRSCPSCGSTFVVPVDYHVADDDHWWLRLRCGECERSRDVTVSNDDAQRYDRELGTSVVGLRMLVEAIDRDAMERELSVLVGMSGSARSRRG